MQFGKSGSSDSYEQQQIPFGEPAVIQSIWSEHIGHAHRAADAEDIAGDGEGKAPRSILVFVSKVLEEREVTRGTEVFRGTARGWSHRYRESFR